jgi:phosphoglycerate dehydrogenase-like enzyme
MNRRTGQRGEGPSIYVGPDDNQFGPEAATSVRQAVESGGGRVSAPEEAEAMVWLGSPSGLADVLHENVRWVQLHSAGVESWVESGIIDNWRVFTSAAGAYAGTVAEHALALMLAGARRLHECARATEWGNRQGRLFAGSTGVILGAGGIGRALIQLLEQIGRAHV